MKKLFLVILLALLFLAGCYPGGPITCTGPGQQPTITSFNAEPASISVGQSSNLSWSVSGATKASIDQGIGNVALTGTRAVAPTATTVYTLIASSATSSVTATTQVIVTGTAVPPTGLPVINSFIASPSGISVGSSTTLIWNVTNATSVTIDNGVGGVSLSGSTVVMPAATITYTLTASNAAGSVTATALVLVSGLPPGPSGPPVINYFTASPPVITGGSGSTFLRWNVSNATSVTIDPGIGSVASSGTMLLTLSSSTNYLLTAINAYGTSYLSLSVTVAGGGSSVVYDFIEQAMSASWKNGVNTNLGFGIEQVDGFAIYRINQRLDDGSIYPKVLETHPQWVNNGSIQGTYPTMTVPAGARFTAKVGFLDGAVGTDGVLFRLTWRESGSPVTVSLGGEHVTYGGPLVNIDVDLSAYAGLTGQFGLKVEAGPSSGQDWAAWAEAKITY